MTSFKTADDLGISDQEHAGLIKIMEHFRTPAAPPRLDDDFVPGADLGVAGSYRLGFSMQVPTSTTHENEFQCSCVACIGGHLSLMMHGVPLSNEEVWLTPNEMDVADRYVYRHDPERGGKGVLATLFYPPQEVLRFGCWGEITPITAALAIENVLTKGDADWADAAHRGGQSDLLSDA
ncbi:hypothetical protein [Methylorubrum populi]|uniref:hypothetical protein n=1 Tax=Methylorubrum populi TaxID=223967 RepID=UPI000DB56100|nr:hypothetical protein [Methylorubrum populi]PZP71796.1 MAG: hypothetical protein DI590_05915 [Methylorubrum populi]